MTYVPIPKFEIPSHLWYQEWDAYTVELVERWEREHFEKYCPPKKFELLNIKVIKK